MTQREYQQQYQAGYRTRNRAKLSEDKKRWYRENKARLLAKEKTLKLQKRYGLTSEQWDTMLASQGGVCAACGTDEPRGNGTWHVDHDHETGKVRALLCLPCNSALGLLGDNADRLLDLLNYIRNY